MRSFPLLVSLAVLLAGCAAKPADNGPANNSTNNTGGMDMTMAPMPVTVTVGGGVCPPSPPSASPDQYTIAPKKLELKVGMRYNLTLKNTGCGAHDLVIDGIEGAKVPSVAAGKEASVEFVAAKEGTFPMYCTLGGGQTAPVTSHKDHGMSGQAVVSA